MKSFKYSFKSLIMLVKRYPVYLLIEAVSLVCGIVSTVVPVYLIRDVVNTFTESSFQIQSVGHFMDLVGYKILIYVGIELGAVLISLLMDFLKSYIERGFYVYVATSLFKKLDSIDYEFHENASFLDNYTRALENGDQNIYNAATGQVQLIKIIFQSASLLAIVFTINYLAIVYAIAIGIIYYFIRIRVNKLNFEHRSAAMPLNRKRNYISRVMYVKESMADIKTTDISDVLLENHKNQSDELLAVAKGYLKKQTLFQILGTLAMTSAYPVIIGIVAYFVLETKDLGSLASLTLAASSLSNLISRFVNQITTIQNYSLEAKVSFDLLDMSGKIEGVKKQEVEENFKKLEIKNIEFAYVDDRKILNDISLYINKGEKIAIVGENGAGKTTLVKLLLRLYDVNKGEILYNDVPYTNLTPLSLRKKVGAVFQQPEVYSVTVAENVLLRKCETKEDEDLVIEALKFSDLYDYVATLEDGIHTMVTREFHRRGTIFSGGQTQKLAVARGYAQNYELFVLDEPSSALDPIAETKMYHNMLELGRNKTLIFISHRLSATVNVDRIYLFEKGKIVEQGSHEELMKIPNGKYKEMFDSQSEKYLRGENHA